MAPRPIYEPVEAGDNASPSASPRLPEADLGTPDLRRSSNNTTNRAQTPTFPVTPPLGSFSSAQAYAPVSGELAGDENMIRSPSSRPFLHSSLSSYSYASRPMSRSSSHFLSNDYDSVHRLGQFGSASPIPMKEYQDKEARSLLTPTPTPREIDEARAAGLAKYGPGKDVKGRKQMSKMRKWTIFFGVVILLIVIIVAVAVPLLKMNDDQQARNTGATGGGTGTKGQVLTSGGNGTTIKTDNGSFVYLNNFGGQWRSGLNDNGAQAQNYTPAMDQPWDFAKNRMLGVNLGGWLVLEPFINPAYFEKYENQTATLARPVVDEYTLMLQWASEGGQALIQSNMKQHYDTFITEEDFAQIAAAGLNWIRLPIGYWAIAKMDNEPFLEGLSWTYLLKAIQWARKYGLRIELDLHSVPGSQNGYNHGGRLGTFNFLNSPAGLVSAERTLDIIRTITEFISQPEIANVVPVFGVLNEPNLPVGIGVENIKRFYGEVYSMIRGVTGTGAGKGPMIVYHDGFMGLSTFSGFMQGGDRVGWDLHPYICFTGPFGPRESLPVAACNGFQGNTDVAFQQFGVTMAGEFSLANNDCGLFLNGPFQGVRFDGSFTSGAFQSQGSCVPFDDWQNYDASTKQTMMDGAVAQMASFQNWFFWTWKIGNSLRTGGPVNPNWSYQLGIQQGWMPTDPNGQMQGACSRMQQKYQGITKTTLDWNGNFADYQTGMASSYSPNTGSFAWPPTSIASSGLATSMPATAIPTYTPTASHLTVAVPVPTVSIKNEAEPSWNPWQAGQYTQPAFTAIAGCNYFPDMQSNITSIPTGWPCSGNNSPSKRQASRVLRMNRRELDALPTMMPGWQ